MNKTVNLKEHKLSKWFFNVEQPFKAEWILLFAFMFLFAISYTYNDIVVTTRHGIRFWDVLFQGKPWEFYNYNYAVQTGNSVFTMPQMAAYDYTVYLLFAVWDFPLWLVEKLFAVNATENVLCLMWAKMQILLAILFSLKMVMKIGEVTGLTKRVIAWLGFAFGSSILLCTSSLIMSQYDIFSVFFMLCGFYAYLKNDNKKFVLYFALAVSCKYFALLVFIPLVLLRCKKVWRIVLYLLGSLSITVFWKLLFALFTKSVEGAAIANALLPTFYTWKISTGLYPASVFVMSMLAVCIWAYATKPNADMLAQNAVFAACAAMLAFVSQSPLNPYWVVLVVPFMVLLIFMNAERFKLNIFLEIAFSLALVVQQMAYFYWCYSDRVVRPMLFGLIKPKAIDHTALMDGVGSLVISADAYFPVLSTMAAIMICAAVALLIFNRPSQLATQKGKEIHIERSVMWVRFVAFAGVGLLPIIYYLIR